MTLTHLRKRMRDGRGTEIQIRWSCSAHFLGWKPRNPLEASCLIQIWSIRGFPPPTNMVVELRRSSGPPIKPFMTQPAYVQAKG